MVLLVFKTSAGPNGLGWVRFPFASAIYLISDVVMEKRRVVLALVLAVAGAGLLAYGVFRNAVTVSSGEPNQAQVAAQS